MSTQTDTWSLTAVTRGAKMRSICSRWGYTIHLVAADAAVVSASVQIWGTNDINSPGLPVDDPVTVSGTVNLASASAPYPVALAGKRDVPFTYHYPVITAISANTTAVINGAGTQ